MPGRFAAAILVMWTIVPSAASSTDIEASDLQAVMDQVAGIRDLAFLRPVKEKRVDGRGMIEAMRRDLSREYRPCEIRAEGDLYKRLGLIPADMDYEKDVLALLEEEVAGLYVPSEQTLYINPDAGSEMEAVTLAHELGHALVDQHFGLESRVDRRKDNGDRLFAFSSLVEGDAMAVTFRYLFKQEGMEEVPLPFLSQVLEGSVLQLLDTSGKLADAPPFIVDSLVFPYLSGMDFVNRLLAAGPSWSGVDQGYLHPPDSSEQIMHPDKYVSREAPDEIGAAPLAVLSGQYGTVFEEVLGEFTFYELIKLDLDRETARAAAAGWGGDRAILFRPKGQKGIENDFLVSLSAWDRGGEDGMDEAREFEKGLVDALAKRYGALLDYLAPIDAWLIRTGNGQESLVRRQGSRVVWIDHAPLGMAERLSGEVLSTWSVKDPNLSQEPILPIL